MAIWYIDPHKQINGNGAFSNAWSISSSVRTGLVSGDEIRIRGVYLTDLLTPNVYTGTFNTTTPQTLTITSGGSGYDFIGNSVIYFPDYDTFAKLTSNTNTSISVSSASCLPIGNTMVTNVTFRKVDTLTYGPSSSTSTAFLGSTVNNQTISDCWIDATTRVTDGSVKTIINSSAATSTSLYLPSSSTTTNNHIIKLENTTILSGNNNSTGYISLIASSDNTRINIGGIYFGTTVGGIGIGSSIAPINNTSINITNVMGGTPINQLYGKNLTLTTSNVIVRNLTDISPYTRTLLLCDNFTYNVGNVTTFFGTSYIFQAYDNAPCNINFNGDIDCAQNIGLSYIFYGYGYFNFNFISSFTFYVNKRASTIASVAYKGYYSPVAAGSPNGGRFNMPTINLPASIIATSNYIIDSGAISSGTSKIGRIPYINYVESETTWGGRRPNGITGGTNILLTYRDGSDPIEILSPYGNGLAVTTAANTSFPIVTKDYSRYRTSGPSLNSYLYTRTASYWTTTGLIKSSVATKAIKVPLSNNYPVTISGYIRSNDTAYSNGDCNMSLLFNNTEVASQAMTTSCINSWENFTLSYTPTQTGEGYLLWDMYYSNGNTSFWLDDLEIS